MSEKLSDEQKRQIDETAQTFTSKMTDFFGITENGEIKGGGVTAALKHMLNAVFEGIQTVAEGADLKYFKIVTAGIGVAFDITKGTIETTIDGRNRSGASPELYARPDIHLLKLLFKGLVTGTADLIIGSKLKIPGESTGGKIKVFSFAMSKSLAISEITGKTFDHFFGSQYATIDFTESKEGKKVLERKYLVQDTLENSLRHYWSDIERDMRSLNRVIVTAEDLNKSNIIYYKENDKQPILNDTLYLEKWDGSSKDEYSLISFLKRFGTDFLPNIKRGNQDPKPKKLVTNYFANSGSGAGRITIDLKNDDKKIAAAYALETLKGYALEEDTPKKEYVNLDMYSKEHIEARANFLRNLIKVDLGQGGSDAFYLDTKTNKQIGSVASGNGSIGTYNRMNVFVDGQYSFRELIRTNRTTKVFGYSNDDTIKLNVRDDVYIESGLGSDTITTGSGKDAIYTNAAIDPEYDYDSGINTVRSGGGNDTIHGSKAKDVIYGEDDDDTIYGREGSDELYGGSGNDTIYTNDKIDDKLDKEGENTANLVVAGQGKDTVYGSAGKDTIYGDDKENDGNNTHILGSDSDTIYGKGGDDVIYAGNDKDTVYGGKGNDEIHGGDDNDAVHGGEENNTLYAGDSSRAANGSDEALQQSLENNYLVGGNSKDTIYGSRGSDIVFGDNINEEEDSKRLIKDILNTNGDVIYVYEGDGIIYGKADNNIMDRYDIYRIVHKNKYTA